MSSLTAPPSGSSGFHDEQFAEVLEAFAKVVAEQLAEHIVGETAAEAPARGPPGVPDVGQKVEAFLHLHENEQERLRKLLPTMRAMAAMCSAAKSLPVTTAEAHLAGLAGLADGRTLGDFRVLREIGRGGMGIVYEAEQISMGRRIALKILPLAAVVDPQHVRRFKNEVQAAALLQHQNIVPVYSVGCERGIHFYAMQYVEGHTLAEIIASLRTLAGMDAVEATAHPDESTLAEVTATLGKLRDKNRETRARGQSEVSAQKSEASKESVESHQLSVAKNRPPTDHGQLTTEEPASGQHPTVNGQQPCHSAISPITPSSTVRDRCRAAARLMIQAAEALDHAHQRGVLHRDVKPGNLIVDVTGNLWVADFGLARLEADAGATMTGQIVGTLRYMSPEQALAKRAVVDHRADIYSLGATLYELCALRPVYLPSDRQELLKQLAMDPPRSLRKIDPAIPREMETIALKALQKEPADRYETAQELADDLRRYLDDRPVLARPPSVGERLRKWSRRHRGTVFAATAVVISFLLVSLAGLSFHSRHVSDANQSLETLNAELVASRDETRELLYLSDMRLAFGAWDGRRLDELQKLLDRHRPRPGETDVRGMEWNLLASLARPPEPVVFLGHDGPVREIAMVPGKDEFVSVGDDGTIRHWSLPAQRPQRQGRLLRTIETDADELHAVAISPDGKWLATGNPTLELWDFATGKKVRDLSRIEYTLESIAFAPDGESIAAAWRYDEVRVVGLEGEERARLPPTVIRIETLVFSRDSQSLFVPFETEEGNVIRRWRVHSPGQWSDLGKSPVGLSRVAVSHDDVLSAAVGYSTGILYFLDNATGHQVGTLGSSADKIRALDFAPYSDGLAWGSDDGTLRVAVLRPGWQFAPSARLQQTVPRAISAHAQKITDVEYLSEQRVLTCSEDGSIKLWSLSETDITMRLELPDDPAYGIAFSPDGKQVAVPFDDGRMWLGTAADGRTVESVRIGDQKLEKIVFLPDGSRIVAGDNDGTLRAWDRSKRRVVAEWHNPQPARVWALAIAPKGGHVASAAADQLLRIHDAESLSVVETISAPANVYALDFSPDGRLLAWGGSFSDLFLYETSAWTQTHRITTRSECHCLAFANDQDLFASGHENGSIQIIDPSKGHVVERLVSGASVQSLAWSPDDRLLVSAHRDGTQRLWHVPSATELGVLHRGGVSGTTRFSPDGARLGTVSGMNDFRSQGILWKLDD